MARHILQKLSFLLTWLRIQRYKIYFTGYLAKNEQQIQETHPNSVQTWKSKEMH